MSENMRNAVEELENHLADLLQQAIDTKKTINSLCRVMNESPRYADADTEVATRGRAIQYRGDEFFGKPLATAVRAYMEARKAATLGPADAEEIFEALQQGGFEFDGKSSDKALHGLKISLSKNTSTFIKLPNGKFSMADWYNTPAKTAKSKGNANHPLQELIIDDITEDEFGEQVEDEVLVPNKPR